MLRGLGLVYICWVLFICNIICGYSWELVLPSNFVVVQLLVAINCCCYFRSQCHVSGHWKWIIGITQDSVWRLFEIFAHTRVNHLQVFAERKTLLLWVLWRRGERLLSKILLFSLFVYPSADSDWWLMIDWWLINFYFIVIMHTKLDITRTHFQVSF